MNTIEHRPESFSNVVGQHDVVNVLKVLRDAAIVSQKPAPHILFNGPPGTGKTTLARAFANELKVNFQIANGGNLRSVKHILPYISKITPRSVLFIDEIHRMSIDVEEFLYPVIEDYQLVKDAKVTHVAPFTLVGATTKPNLISKPLMDRFTIKQELEMYSIEDLKLIIATPLYRNGILITNKACRLVAEASRETPRVAINLAKWLESFCVSSGYSVVKDDVAKQALYALGVYENGYTKYDMQYLDILRKSKEPLSLNSIASKMNLDTESLDEIEAFLMRRGQMKKTQKGRVYNG